MSASFHFVIYQFYLFQDSEYKSLKWNNTWKLHSRSEFLIQYIRHGYLNQFNRCTHYRRLKGYTLYFINRYLRLKLLITIIYLGIGKGLIEAYLLRPNHIVIGSVRDKSSPNYAELKKLPTAEGSRLILISIENSELDGPEKALKDVASQGIDHIDVIIANAAICPYPAPLQNVAVQDVLDALRINAVSPVQLYHATRPFLAKSSQPVWLSLSSVVGSIKNVEIHKADSFLAYGVSKSALGFFTM